MTDLSFELFILLSVSLILGSLKKNKLTKFIRIGVLLVVLIYFAYTFTLRSISDRIEDGISLKITNKLSQPIDFYLIKLKNSEVNAIQSINHTRVIHPNHSRTEVLLNKEHPQEFWLTGYIGKMKQVYFTQHHLKTPNQDTEIEIENYINQSQKLSEQATDAVVAFRSVNNVKAIWVSLCFLLFFLNLIVLVKLEKTEH